jgi:hypothetical protein
MYMLYMYRYGTFTPDPDCTFFTVSTELLFSQFYAATWGIKTFGSFFKQKYVAGTDSHAKTYISAKD